MLYVSAVKEAAECIDDPHFQLDTSLFDHTPKSTPSKKTGRKRKSLSPHTDAVSSPSKRATKNLTSTPAASTSDLHVCIRKLNGRLSRMKEGSSLSPSPSNQESDDAGDRETEANSGTTGVKYKKLRRKQNVGDSVPLDPLIKHTWSPVGGDWRTSSLIEEGERPLPQSPSHRDTSLDVLLNDTSYSASYAGSDVSCRNVASTPSPKDRSFEEPHHVTDNITYATTTGAVTVSSMDTTNLDSTTDTLCAAPDTTSLDPLPTATSSQDPAPTMSDPTPTALEPADNENGSQSSLGLDSPILSNYSVSDSNDSDDDDDLPSAVSSMPVKNCKLLPHPHVFSFYLLSSPTSTSV